MKYIISEYKGYKAKISGEGICLHGTVTNIDDVITFRGLTIDEAITEFERSVDAYLEYCKHKGVEPNKPRD